MLSNNDLHWFTLSITSTSITTAMSYHLLSDSHLPRKGEESPYTLWHYKIRKLNLFQEKPSMVIHIASGGV